MELYKDNKGHKNFFFLCMLTLMSIQKMHVWTQRTGMSVSRTMPLASLSTTFCSQPQKTLQSTKLTDHIQIPKITLNNYQKKCSVTYSVQFPSSVLYLISYSMSLHSCYEYLSPKPGHVYYFPNR